jgi:hypothetical protein
MAYLVPPDTAKANNACLFTELADASNARQSINNAADRYRSFAVAIIRRLKIWYFTITSAMH